MLKKDKNYKNTPSKNFDNIILSSFPQEISVRPLPDITGVEARVFYQSLSLRFNNLIVDVDGRWMDVTNLHSTNLRRYIFCLCF